MKAPFSLLRTFAPDLPEPTALADILTAGGLEVESCQPVVPDFSQVVVGQVTEVAPVEGSVKLSLCQVEVGGGEKLQIVCGAPVIRPGKLYPVAVPGASLPGGVEITERKLAGVESRGMLCSAIELGLGEDSEGILELPEGLDIGQPIREQLQLDDRVLDLNLTPNRADCFGLEGLARDAAALTGGAFHPQDIAAAEVTCDQQVGVQLPAPADCPHYVCRVILGLDRSVPSPFWLQDRLHRMGQRSIDPVVDVTNYVMMELGQPLHAFDCAAIDGDIIVRRAQDGEELELLDGSVATLTDEDLLIADKSRPLGLAGIKGGASSAVGDQTTDVLLESAFFRPTTLARTARRLGLATEASHRFERGVSPDLQRRALERATGLIVEICGGRAGPVEEALEQQHLPARTSLQLSFRQLGRILGIEVDAQTRATIDRGFSQLGFAPENLPDGWQIQVPPHRFDLSCSENLAEEAARILGFDELPEDDDFTPAAGVHPQEESRTRRITRWLVESGWTEATTYSFVDPQLQHKLLPSLAQTAELKLASPLAETLSVMRLSLVPGLVQTLEHNLAHRQERLKLFEVGRCFRRCDGAVRETLHLAGLMYGPRYPLSWALPGSENLDFYDAKGALEQLLANLGLETDFRLSGPDRHSADWPDDSTLHPHRHALVLARAHGGDWVTLGWVGCLYPRLAASFRTNREIVLFELQLDALPQPSAMRTVFQPFARFPRIRRDLSLLVPEHLDADSLLKTARSAGGQALQSCTIFDRLDAADEDSGTIPDGFYSLALALQWQPTDSTWKADTIQQTVDGVLVALEKQGISLRFPHTSDSADKAD